MNYDASELSNLSATIAPSSSQDTQDAIDKALNIEKLSARGKGLVAASTVVAASADGNPTTFDLTQDLKDVKGEKLVSVSIDAQPGQDIELTIPHSTAKAYVFDTAGDVTTSFRTGHSVIVSGSGDDTLTVKGAQNFIDAGNGDNDVTTGGGKDTIVAGDGNDTIDGGNGNDSISSGAGDDSISGGNGRDYLDGGAGNDSISGGNGNDTLEGGLGNDSLVGGKGVDTYVWKEADVEVGGHDIVDDGKGSKLVINFSGLQVNGDTLSDLSKGKFDVGDTLDAENNIAFQANENGDGGVLQIDVNGDGGFDAATDFQIEIVGTNVSGVQFNAHSDTFTLV